MASLARATGMVLILNLFSKGLGFLRDASLAARFGASQATDAYLLAYTLPYSVQAVLGMAFLLVMVPLLTDTLAEGEKEAAYQVAGEVMGRLAFWIFIGVAVAMVFVHPLARLLAPGFSGLALEETTNMMRIMLPSIFFMSFAMLFSGILNGQGKFALAAFGPASVNLVVIFSIFVLGDFLGIYGVALGSLAGFILFALLLYGGVRRQGFRLSRLSPKLSPPARRLLRDIVFLVVSVSVSQLFFMVGRAFGSGLATGAVTSFDFAYRIISLPIGIVTAAVVTTGYPRLSQGAKRKDAAKVSQAFSHMIRHVMVWALPAALGIMVLRQPLVRLLFQRGSFDQLAAQMTSQSLFYFSLLTVTISLDMVITRGFYAHRDYRWPLVSGVLALGLQVFLSSLWASSYGHEGVALANALAHLAYTLLLLGGFYQKKCILDPGRLALSLLKFLLAGLVMAWSVLSLRGLLAHFLGASFGQTLVLLALSVLVGMGVYFAGLWALKAEEVYDIGRALLARRRKSS